MTRYAPKGIQTEVVEDNALRPDKGYTLLSIVMLGAGIVLLVWPLVSLTFICYAIGAALMAAGVVAVVRSGKQHAQRMPSGIMMGLGIFLILAGLFFLLGTGFIIAMVPVTFGVMLLIDAVFKLTCGMDLRVFGVGSWASVAVTAVIMVILAGIFMFHPFGTAAAMTRFLAVLLIIDAAMNLWYVFVLHKKRA